MEKGPNLDALDTPDKLQAFFKQSSPLIYSYFYQRCGGNVTVAEDLTQETFTAAAQSIRNGKAGSFPIRWILGIARHVFLDHVEREERERRKLNLVIGETRRAEQLQSGDDLSRDQARAALGKVPPAQRKVLILRYLDDLPVPEVATLIGRSIHATESLLARGRESFRRAYVEGSND